MKYAIIAASLYIAAAILLVGGEKVAGFFFGLAGIVSYMHAIKNK